jgi:phage terminase large subunit-like protein
VHWYEKHPGYSKKEADYAVDFIKNLKHTKGRWAGIRFNLLPWQEHDIVRPLFGILRPDGYRQYNTVYVEVSKKNGKTELGSAIALLLLSADGEVGAEVYSAAADKDQATLVFRPAAAMVRGDKVLKKHLKVLDSSRRIVDYKMGSYYQVLSSDVPTKHGLNVHGVIIDELHAQPNRNLYDVLTEGSGDARTQPVFLFLTTAGYDKHSICWEVHEYAIKVRDGIIEDPTFLPVIYAAADEEEWDTVDWTDEKIWRRANPSLGETIDIERLRAACKKAQEVPALENSFKRLRLNIWTAQETKWLPMTAWDATGGIVDPSKLKGEECYGGLDLASSIDIAAFVLNFPGENGHIWLPFFWIPEENIAERVKKDRVPYDMWVKQGLIRTTSGRVIDYRVIREDIVKLGDMYDIREIAFDRWGAIQITQDLTDEGFTMIQFGQGMASMAAPTKELLAVVLQERLIHGGNKVLRWMASNMMVKEDPAGNVKPDKAKSSEKIDGIVAGIMALARGMLHVPTESVYESDGMFTLGA